MEYTPEELINTDERELRKEYTRLRDIAQKRLKRLKDAGYGETETARHFKNGVVPKLSELTSKESIAFALTDLADFVAMKQSTVTGMRTYYKEARQTIKKDEKLDQILTTLNKHFPKHEKFDEQNIDLFFEFMNTEVAQNLEKFVSSDRIAQLYKVARSKRLRNMNSFLKTEKQLLYFIKNLENFEAVDLPEGASISAYKRMIQSEINHGRDRSIIYKQQFIDDNRKRRKETKARDSKRSRRKK